MPLGRRMTKDVMERYAADQELAGTYRDRLADAVRAEDAFRRAQAEGAARPTEELRALAVELDRALTEALRAAEAAERVAMGPKTYAPQDAKDPAKARRAAEIARRKAKARTSVRPWTDEVDRLRTAREAHRLTFRVGRGVAA
ncbi:MULTISPECIES: plectin [Thermomonospora]|uniref:Lon protease-like protein n=1 Tax=Thermomonospora cellulosilytica TaxID=1411118 RepID=A0A7W3N149_9ACTN|nr:MULTISPECIES: plectin [Thermomonospora]MBA9005635.1 Lon protease-like protein [Thermomonospora cellulosilytica]